MIILIAYESVATEEALLVMFHSDYDNSENYLIKKSGGMKSNCGIIFFFFFMVVTYREGDSAYICYF